MALDWDNDLPVGYYHRSGAYLTRPNAPRPLPSWQAVAFQTMPRLQPWADTLNEYVLRLTETAWAIQEISVIRVVAQHRWAWGLIGIPQWAQRFIRINEEG
jgi:hypothetical protein